MHIPRRRSTWGRGQAGPPVGATIYVPFARRWRCLPTCAASTNVQPTAFVLRGRRRAATPPPAPPDRFKVAEIFVHVFPRAHAGRQRRLVVKFYILYRTGFHVHAIFPFLFRQFNIRKYKSFVNKKNIKFEKKIFWGYFDPARHNILISPSARKRFGPRMLSLSIFHLGFR